MMLQCHYAPQLPLAPHLGGVNPPLLCSAAFMPKLAAPAQQNDGQAPHPLQTSQQLRQMQRSLREIGDVGTAHDS
jgi:hypothetical protein